MHGRAENTTKRSPRADAIVRQAHSFPLVQSSEKIPHASPCAAIRRILLSRIAIRRAAIAAVVALRRPPDAHGRYCARDAKVTAQTKGQHVCLVKNCTAFYKNFIDAPCCRQRRWTSCGRRRGTAQRGKHGGGFHERPSRDAGWSRCASPLRASLLSAMQRFSFRAGSFRICEQEPRAPCVVLRRLRSRIFDLRELVLWPPAPAIELKRQLIVPGPWRVAR